MDLEKGIHTNGMQGQQEILSQKSVGYFHLCNNITQMIIANLVFKKLIRSVEVCGMIAVSII